MAQGVLGMATALYDADLSRQQRIDAMQWRGEDVAYRNETVEWRKMDILWRQADLMQRDLDNRRREIDEKNEQLRQLANVAAIIAGFSLTALVQISYPPDVPEVLLALLGLTTSFTVCTMVYSSLVCTLMLIATLKKFEGKDGTGFQMFPTEATNASMNDVGSSVNANNYNNNNNNVRPNDKSVFERFWENQCASDWSRAVHAFSYGLIMFLINLIIIGWVRFYPLLSPPIIVTVISALTLTCIVFSVNLKWLNYLFLRRAASSNSAFGVVFGGAPASPV